jgi:hypothetical protein
MDTYVLYRLCYQITAAGRAILMSGRRRPSATLGHPGDRSTTEAFVSLYDLHENEYLRRQADGKLP